MKRLTRAAGPLLTIIALTVSVHARDQSATNETVISQARDAYYSLAKKGFKGFTATVEPNWEVILGPTATPENLKIFRDVRFSIVVDASGAVTVSHELGPNASSSQLQPTVNRIHFHIQTIVNGFFNTWRTFAIASPFTETDIKIENAGKQYRASYTTQSGDVMMAIAADFSVKEWNLATPTRKETVKPRFQKTAEGFLLTDYKHVFEPAGEGVRTNLDIHIDYQNLDVMKIPQKVRLGGMYGSERVEAELVFVLKS